MTTNELRLSEQPAPLDALAVRQPHVADMVRLLNTDGFTVEPTPFVTSLGLRPTDIETFLRSSGWAAARLVAGYPDRPKDR